MGEVCRCVSVGVLRGREVCIIINISINISIERGRV